MTGPFSVNTPQYQYARLVPPRKTSEYVTAPFETMQTLIRGVNQKKTTDYHLSFAKEPLAVGGGLILATLATFGSFSKTFGIGHVAGFVAWMGALLFGPKVANGLIQLKTGINLNQEYVNTYHERYGLFRDPQYMPMHLLPEEQLNRIGDRLNIPYGVDRRRMIEEKIKQISVQTQTWWHLVSGVAVPVVALGLMDSAFNSLLGIIGRVKSVYHANLGLHRAESAAQIYRHLDAFVDEKVGDGANSWITRWKKRFQNDVVSNLRLEKVFKPSEVMKMSDERLVTELIKHFTDLSKSPEKRQALDDILHYLERQRQVIESLEHDVLQTIGRSKRMLGALENGEAELRVFEQGRSKKLLGELARKKGSAMSGLRHYETLFNGLLRGNISASDVRILFEKPVVGEVDRLIRAGRIEDARRLTGDTELFKEIRKLLFNENRTKAAELLGDSPRKHLLASMKNFFAKKVWRRRMLLYLGGGALLATVLYDMLFVGQPFIGGSGRARS